MGIPFFQIRPLVERHNVQVFSSNYALYAHMSQRMMHCFEMFCPDMEIYSIDEAFLSLHTFRHYDLISYAKTIRSTILQWTGLPVSIGIAPTKTLAKMANHLAKKNKTGVFMLSAMTSEREVFLKNFPIEDIWGIGRKLTPKLQALGIQSAYDLSKAPIKNLRKQFSVQMERTILELQGIASFGLEAETPKKNILSSRSFGRPILLLRELEEAISTYTAIACEKLRQQKGITATIAVFLTTSRFNPNYYANQTTITLTHPTQDTRIILEAAIQGIRNLYRPGFVYNKCGVLLCDIISEKVQQQDLFSETESISKVSQIVDVINQKYGRNTLIYASEGFSKTWASKRISISPRYTTHWEELVVAKI
jgi:DNA polymerase V